MRLYLDANRIICSIEGVPEFRTAALAWIEEAEAAGGAVITSRLSRLECRVLTAYQAPPQPYTFTVRLRPFQGEPREASRQFAR